MAKIKVDNNWVLGFNSFRTYLNNNIDPDTRMPRVNLGRTVTYAVNRTAKKIKDELELIGEEQKSQEVQREDKRREIEQPDHVKALATSPEYKKLCEDLDEQFAEFMKKEIEVEVHKFNLTDLPETCNLPEVFMGTLSEMMHDEPEAVRSEPTK